MNFIALVLTAKIALTTPLIAIPFLVLPAARLTRATGVTGGGETFFRLYGIAILALLVGYASGFWMIARGEFPWGVVMMGIVSNGGAAAFLLATGAWRRLLPITIVVVTMSIGLISAAVFPIHAMQPLW